MLTVVDTSMWVAIDPFQKLFHGHHLSDKESVRDIAQGHATTMYHSWNSPIYAWTQLKKESILLPKPTCILPFYVSTSHLCIVADHQ